MALDISLEEALKLIGHDGSDIWWPELPEPLRRRSFHIQEMVDLAYRLGKAVIPIEASPTVCPQLGGPVKPVPMPDVLRIQQYMVGNVGVLTGMGVVGRHAVAWDGSCVLDPCSVTQEFRPDTFYLVKELR
jgi:hypothetical protein